MKRAGEALSGFHQMFAAIDQGFDIRPAPRGG